MMWDVPDISRPDDASHADHVVTARTAYDAGAEAYVEWVGTEISPTTEGVLDRSVLESFAHLVSEGPGGRVADVGCGPGRVAAFLAARGVEVVGLDGSWEMLAAASIAHPAISLTQATLTALPFCGLSLAGVVSWYSIIHTPPELLDRVWAELRRVVRPGGQLLVAFQAGEGEAHLRNEVFGRPVSLTSYRHAPIEVERSLVKEGFRLHARIVRDPALAHETTPQAFIIAEVEIPK